MAARAQSILSAVLLVLAGTTGAAESSPSLYLRASPSSKAGKWKPELPWRRLRRKLVNRRSLIDVGPSDFAEECLPEFERAVVNRTNWALIDKPSGVCMDQLFCAFDDCDPKPGSAQDSLAERYQDIQSILVRDITGGTYSDLPDEYQSWVEDTSNPKSAIPGKVLHPRTASDVVAAVEFAGDHGLEISVKTSGHSYTASSTKADTLLINMRRYPAYASGGTVIDCSDLSEDELSSADLSGQPCALSLAANKTGVVRVGGGQVFGDLYQAVLDYNLANDPENFKYHVVGGGAATVSPQGWAFEGGISGTSGGRLFGHGVDQILQIEMVLPSGQHVKFGPTDVETVEGALVPKTVAVTGLCRSNPNEKDEDKWVWEECPEVPFGDLWFAQRGGGGGTYGVVVSTYRQLHDYPGKLNVVHLPMDLVSTTTKFCNDDLTDDQKTWIEKVYYEFLTLFLWDPTSLGYDEIEGFRCGAPNLFFTSVFCFGEQVMTDAWEEYLRSLEDAPLTEAQLDKAAQCYSVEQYADYASATPLHDERFPGKIADTPQPFLTTEGMSSVIQVPVEWLLENYDNPDVPDWLKASGNSYVAYGGYNAQATSDQANAMSSGNRLAAFENYYGIEYLNDTFYAEFFPQMYDTSDPENFPSFVGTNHRSPYMRGPLKSDWTKACPMEWTTEERDEKCISLQECMYGTKLLKKLEAIKRDVDPDNMFNCHYCVGSVKSKEIDQPYVQVE